MGQAEQTLKNSPAKSGKRGNTGKLISSYYLEIEYLLDRIEQSTTHYQVLALERSATAEEVTRAYHETVKVLHPGYHKVRAAISDEVLERIDQSFNRVSNAFIVLTDRSRKLDYDRSLSRGPNAAPIADGPQSEPTTKPSAPEPAVIEKDAGSSQDAIRIRNCVSGQAVYSKPIEGSDLVNRRRCERFKLAMPIMLIGHDQETGRWQEVGKTIDVSKMGVGITITRRVLPGVVVHATLPLPTKLRSHGYSDPSYKVYGIVRRTEPVKDGSRVIGLEFLSEHPPGGYLKEPWAAFRTQKWPGADRRREPRVNMSEVITVEYLDDSMIPIRQESAVTENLSLSGARIRVKNPSPESDVLLFTHRTRGFQGLAEIRNRYTAKDGFERLCLRFLDSKYPL
jgi:curved DNA-binding protein CbpA